MNSTVQLYEFMGCIYAGLIMGIIYSVLDVIRILTGKRAVVTVILDTLFLASATVIACVALYMLTYGRVALYHFLGFLTGILLYINDVHYLFLKIFSMKNKQE